MEDRPEKSRGGVPIAPGQLLLDMDSHWLTVVVKAQKDPHAMLFCTHIKHDVVFVRGPLRLLVFWKLRRGGY